MFIVPCFEPEIPALQSTYGQTQVLYLNFLNPKSSLWVQDS